jgi:hypothetical protein
MNENRGFKSNFNNVRTSEATVSNVMTIINKSNIFNKTSYDKSDAERLAKFIEDKTDNSNEYNKFLNKVDREIVGNKESIDWVLLNM